MPDKKKEAFRLTPKGFLSMKLGVNISPLWNELTEFVKAEAARNGMTEGVPCLVLVDGGHCITAGIGIVRGNLNPQNTKPASK